MKNKPTVGKPPVGFAEGSAGDLFSVDLDVFEGPFDLLITLVLNKDVDLLEGPARALVAASFGSARLIDNVLLPWSGSEAVQNTRREGA